MKWHVHREENEWAVADYWLTLEDGVLRYQAEGRDNPKDLWGWDRSYPPRKLDEFTWRELLQLFGEELRTYIEPPQEVEVDDVRPDGAVGSAPGEPPLSPPQPT